MDENDICESIMKVEKNFKLWLRASKLSEQEFLSYGAISNFEILTDCDVMKGDGSGYKIVLIGQRINGMFTRVGEKLIYPENDLKGFSDFSTLLIYMAQKLDNENKKIPVFEQRQKYFYSKVQAFIENTDEYMKLCYLKTIYNNRKMIQR